MTAIAERIPVIDTDSHVSEPPDLWRSRLPKKCNLFLMIGPPTTPPHSRLVVVGLSRLLRFTK